MATRFLRSAIRSSSHTGNQILWSVRCQPRQLSTTAARQATQVVSFEKTSSPELDNFLNDLREKLILPAYIPHEDRQKLGRAKYEQELKTDPVTLEIDGEVKRYRYENPVTNPKPKIRWALYEGCNMMKTAEDFSNLPALYTGLVKVAGLRPHFEDRPRMARVVGNAGGLDVLLRMAKHAKQTGFVLDQPEIISAMLAAMQKPTISSNWAKEETEKALRQTEHLLELLEQDIHQTPTSRMQGSYGFLTIKPHLDPLYLGPRLHLAAMLAVQHNDAKDADGKVFKYARQLVAAWPEGKGLLQLHSPEAYRSRWVLRWLGFPPDFLSHVSPILHGLKAASQVVDGEVSEQLKARAAALEAEVKNAWDRVKDKTYRGPELYKTLFGGPPS